jgi:hypothetical protein
MVKCNPHLKRSHLLLELVEYAKVTIYTIVLGDKLEQWHSNITKNDIVTVLHHFVIFNGLLSYFIKFSLVQVITFSQLINFLFLGFDNVMSNFENGSLIFEIFKDFSIHLQVHFKYLSKDRVQTVKKHSCLILGKVLK